MLFLQSQTVSVANAIQWIGLHVFFIRNLYQAIVLKVS